MKVAPILALAFVQKESSDLIQMFVLISNKKASSAVMMCTVTDLSSMKDCMKTC